MQGRRWLEYVHPEDRAMVEAELDRQLQEGDSLQLPEYRIITADGQVRWVSNRGRVVCRGRGGEVLHFVGLDLDITGRKEMEWMLELLREAGAIITSTLDSSEVIRRVLDQAGRFIPYETAAVLLLENGRLKLVAGRGWQDFSTVKDLSIPYPGDNPNTKVLEEKQAQIIAQPAAHYSDFAKLGDRAVQCWMGIPLIARGEAIGMVTFDSYSPDSFTSSHRIFAAMLAEQIAQALHNARIFEHTHREATRDPLTGTLTRRALYSEARNLLKETPRHGGSLALLMFDIDHFKHFNDSYGHAEGDEALRSLTETCRARLRPFDLFGRYGGEEFVVILPRSDEEAAAGAAERLRRSVEETPVGEARRKLTISVGVAVHSWSHTGEPRKERPPAAEDGAAADTTDELQASLDLLIQQADKALYEAKHRGRNQVVRFSEIADTVARPAPHHPPED
jgi:diguanylate cyclase (GGDEF)-like protein